MENIYIYKTCTRIAAMMTACATGVRPSQFIIHSAIQRVSGLVTGARDGTAFARLHEYGAWVPVVVTDAERTWDSENKVAGDDWQFGLLCPPWDHVLWESLDTPPTKSLVGVWAERTIREGEAAWFPADNNDLRNPGIKFRRVRGPRLVQWQQLYTVDGMRHGNAVVADVDDSDPSDPKYRLVTDFGNVLSWVSIRHITDDWHLHRQGEFVVDEQFAADHQRSVRHAWALLDADSADKESPLGVFVRASKACGYRVGFVARSDFLVSAGREEQPMACAIRTLVPGYEHEPHSTIGEVLDRISVAQSATRESPVDRSVDILGLVMGIISEYTDAAVQPSTPISALGMDSLDYMDAILELESAIILRFDITYEIEEEDAEAWKTVGDIVEFVRTAVAPRS